MSAERDPDQAPIPAGVFIGETYSAAVPLLEAAGTVAGINEAVAVLRGGVTNETLLPPPLRVLSAKQADAFRNMLRAQQRMPYGEMLRRMGVVSNWLGELDARRTAIEGGEFEEALTIRREGAEIVGIVPEVEAEIAGIIEQEIARLAEERLRPLQREHAVAASLQQRLGELATDISWLPIPAALSSERRSEIWQEVEAETAEGDNFVTEPHPVEGTPRENPRSSNGYLTGATEFLALVLIDQPGRAYTLKELGELIYSDVSGITEVQAANRTLALIRIAERDAARGKEPRLFQLLAQARFRLERGERANPGTRPLAIFRVVPLEAPNTAE